MKQLSSLTLDIKDISEANKLYNFMFGLHMWAQLELRKKGVRDLPSTMAAANALVDYCQNKENGEKQQKPKLKDKGKRKEGEEKKPKFKGKADFKGKAKVTDKQP
jgi:hypothetical protein